MKICILTPRFPFPEKGGDVLRINHIARYLKAQGHDLILVSFIEGEADLEAALTLYARIHTVKLHKANAWLHAVGNLLMGKPMQCGYYRSRKLAKIFHEMVEHEQPDRHIAHLIRMVPYLVNEGLQAVSVVEMTDALSRCYAMVSHTRGDKLKRFVYAMERRLVEKYEQRVIKEFPKTVLVSKEDIKYLKGDKLSFHPNGVDCSPTLSDRYDAHAICFLGNMRALPNQDAILHFVDDIFPRVLQQHPDTVLYIVGEDKEGMLFSFCKRHPHHIKAMGFVENLEYFLQRMCLTVAPLRMAAGIQNKVLQSMAVGTPVVLSSLLTTAIQGLRDGKNCLIADDDETFAKKCITLMENPSLRKDIAQQGYALMKNHYQWEQLLEGYLEK